MSIHRLLRQCFMQYGYARAIITITEEEYRAVAEDARLAYDMTPEEYLSCKGLNIEIQVL